MTGSTYRACFNIAWRPLLTDAFEANDIEDAMEIAAKMAHESLESPVGWPTWVRVGVWEEGYANEYEERFELLEAVPPPCSSEAGHDWWSPPEGPERCHTCGLHRRIMAMLRDPTGAKRFPHTTVYSREAPE